MALPVMEFLMRSKTMLASCSKLWPVLEVTQPFQIEKKPPAATNMTVAVRVRGAVYLVQCT